MKWMNKYQLPDRVLRVIKGGYKEKKPKPNRLSITDLIDEPLQRILYIHHWDDIVRDYSDLLQATPSVALHERYEKYAGDDDDAEHKFEDAISDIIVVGKADNYFDNTILDVKEVNVYGPQYKKDKWEAQLNCYAWQRRKREQDVDKLLIDLWYRNWSLSNIHYRNYPEILYEEMELPLWTFEQQEDYIRSQVQKHLHYPVFYTPEQYEFPCSDKTRGIRFEAYKKGNKTPSKVGDTFYEVNKWVQSMFNREAFSIIKSEPVFCKRYCKVRSICPFSKK